MYDADHALRMGIPCLWMRGGTSKGAIFLAQDLPSDPSARDALLLRIMGSPDLRQIDGIGGGDSLTSKVAIISRATRADADIDYLFLQVFVDQALVSSKQTCGNILAAVGPAAIERGLIAPTAPTTSIRVHMLNSHEQALVEVSTPNQLLTYQGNQKIDGVPGHHAPVKLTFNNIEGSMCQTLLPTGRAVDQIDGIDCCLIDNGMPIVIMAAQDFDLTGQEMPQTLDANSALKTRIEAIRLQAGQMMHLGDVAEASVPKMVLVSAPLGGGLITTRAFIPKKAHSSIGIFAAISVATACRMPQSPAAKFARYEAAGLCDIEHPTGKLSVYLDLDAAGQVVGAGNMRTARKLFDGRVFI